MTCRHSARQTVTAILLVVLALRLAFSLLDLLLRLAVWILLRACWAVEWAVDRLSTRETLRPGAITQVAMRPTPVPPSPQAQRVSPINSGRTLAAVPPVRDDSHEVERMARALNNGRAPRPADLAMAKQLLPTRLPVSR